MIPGARKAESVPTTVKRMSSSNLTGVMSPREGAGDSSSAGGVPQVAADDRFDNPSMPLELKCQIISH